jgi:hypothetical protein
LGRTDDQALVRKIGRKIIKEINNHTRQFNELRERLSKLGPEIVEDDLS